MSTEQTTHAGPTPEQLLAAQEAEARLKYLLSLGDISQANSVTGIYGDTGSGKSTLADTAIEYGWRRYHKISRVVVPDLGGFGNKRLRLIRLGIAQVYNPMNHIEPFETMEDLSKGYWPETMLDPYTGLAAPDVKLVPPETVRWVVYCKQGHQVKALGSRALLSGFSTQCPVCKGAPITPQTFGKVEMETVRSGWIQHVGLYIMDSGTGLADWAMEDMSDRAAKADPNIKDGNNLSNTGARVMSGRYAFGANTQAHYGFAQNAVRRWIKNSRLIPGMVMPPIWTFLENRGGDDNKGISVFGPKIPGDAKTAIVPSWLGNCLHTTKELNAKGVDAHRLYLVSHTDKNNNVPHLAKTRAEPGSLPALLEDVDDQGAPLPAFTRFSLAYFFDQLEHALDNAAREDVVEFPDAPVFQPLKIEGDQVVGQEIASVPVAATARIAPTAAGAPKLAVVRPAGAPPVVVPVSAPSLPAPALAPQGAAKPAQAASPAPAAAQVRAPGTSGPSPASAPGKAALPAGAGGASVPAAAVPRPPATSGATPGVITQAVKGVPAAAGSPQAQVAQAPTRPAAVAPPGVRPAAVPARPVRPQPPSDKP